MYIGPVDGCHEVPEPIAPIEITFVSLEPTRIPMSLSLMTSSGPISIEPMPCVSIWPIASGDGEGAGICIPGVCRCGVADGDGLGVATGVGLAFGAGIWWP